MFSLYTSISRDCECFELIDDIHKTLQFIEKKSYAVGTGSKVMITYTSSDCIDVEFVVISDAELKVSINNYDYDDEVVGESYENTIPLSEIKDNDREFVIMITARVLNLIDSRFKE